MEACLHFRGAALNASEAGISRATKDDGPLRTAVAKAIMLPCGDKRGIDCWSLVASGGENFDKRCRDFAFGKIAESPKFSGEEDSSLQTAVCLIERSEL